MRYIKPLPVVLSALLMLLLFGSMCAAQSDEVFQPPFGYYNGGRVYYLLTDVSNYTLATDFDARNYDSATFGIATSPRLSNAIAPGVTLPVMYYVTNQEQPLIFGSQWPNSTYMPAWRVIKVNWNIPVSQRYVLKSALAVNIARQSGKVTLTTTDQVANASILINTAGAVIPQGQAGMLNGDVWIALPTFYQYYNGTLVRAFYLDFGYQSEASFYGANYAPAMNQLNLIRAQGLPDAWRQLYARFVNFPNQFPITPTIPGVAGYSPLVNEWQLTAKTVFPPSPIMNFGGGDGVPNAWLKTPTNFMGNEPIIEFPL